MRNRSRQSQFTHLISVNEISSQLQHELSTSGNFSNNACAQSGSENRNFGFCHQISSCLPLLGL